MKRIPVWSYGGGIQTIAKLVLIAQRKIEKPVLAVFANTARERQSTWDYLNQYAKPLMDELGIRFVIAERELATFDLYQGTKLAIPAFIGNGGGKLSIGCSDHWKKRVVRRKLRQLGYGPKNPVEMWIGMSLDEVHRMKHSDVKWIKNRYPLIEDYPLRRFECEKIIRDFGLPVPSKSSCWMCPHMKNHEWAEMKEIYPDDWQAAIELDESIRNHSLNGTYLHFDRVPLTEANLSEPDKSEGLVECSFSCWT